MINNQHRVNIQALKDALRKYETVDTFPASITITAHGAILETEREIIASTDTVAERLEQACDEYERTA